MIAKAGETRGSRAALLAGVGTWGRCELGLMAMDVPEVAQD